MNLPPHRNQTPPVNRGHGNGSKTRNQRYRLLLASTDDIDFTHDHAQDIIQASYFDSDVVGADIYRDLTNNNIRCLQEAQLQSYHDATDTSGDTTGHQGYTTDGTFHYAFDTDSIFKNTDDATWKTGGTGPDKVDSNTSPFTNLEATTDHLGDGQYYDGQLLVACTNGNTSAPFLSQLAIYDVTSGLPYNHHVLLDTSRGASGLAYNSALDEVYVPSFYSHYTTIDVYDLSDIKAQTAGTAATRKRQITLDFPAYKTQGVYYRASTDELYLSLNDGEIFVYSLAGAFQRSYFIDGDELPVTGGNQGIDYSTSQMRLCKSNAADQGVVNYFDIDSIPTASAVHDGGIRIEHAHCLRLVFDDNYSAMNIPDQGTLVTRFKVRSGGTRMWMNPRSSTSDFIGRTQDSSFPVKITAWINAFVTQTIDGTAQNTWVDVAFSWDKTGGVVSDAQCILTVDGAQETGVDDPWPTLPKDFGIGAINKGKGASGDTTLPDFDFQYWYMYDVVKSLAQIDAIHANPTEMIL